MHTIHTNNAKYTHTHTNIHTYIPTYIHTYINTEKCTYIQDDAHIHACLFTSPPTSAPTGWRKLIGCLKSQIIFRKRATNYRVILWKMTYNEASYGSAPPCSQSGGRRSARVASQARLPLHTASAVAHCYQMTINKIKMTVHLPLRAQMH